MSDDRTSAARDRIVAQGECALCGGPFARHRMIDAQMERVAAGEPIDEVASDYGMGVPEMVDEWATLIVLLYDELARAVQR